MTNGHVQFAGIDHKVTSEVCEVVGNDFLFEAYRKDFEYAGSIKLPSAEFSYGLFASKRLRASVAQGRHLVTIKLKTQ